MKTSTTKMMRTRTTTQAAGRSCLANRAGRNTGRNGSVAQRGIALLVALVVLIVVTLLGTAAMRSALFQSKVAVNAQASQLLFQGAESGLEIIASHAANPVPVNLFQQVVNQPGTVVHFCLSQAAPGFVTDNGATIAGSTATDITVNMGAAACSALDGANVEVDAILTSPPPAALGIPVQPPQGYSLSSYSQAMVYARSYAEIDDFGGPKSHVQTWAMLTPLDE